MDKYGFNELILNSKSISFENLLTLAAEESLENPRLRHRYEERYKEPKMEKHKEPKMEKHKGVDGLFCKGVGIDFNGMFICAKCNYKPGTLLWICTE